MRSPKCRFGRFSAVGILGAGVQLLLLFWLTKSFGFPSFTATPVAVEFAILHNFIWHERFTWGDIRAKDKMRLVDRLWRFHAANGLISLGGNTILLYCLIERLKAPAIPSAIGAILLCSVANFFLADRWVFGCYKAPMRARRADIIGRDPT